MTMAGELVFVAVLGLLGIYLLLGIWGAVREALEGTGPRKEVLGFLLAVLILLVLGVVAYARQLAPAAP